MKIYLLVTGLLMLAHLALAQDSSYIIRRKIPVKVIYPSQDQRHSPDTVSAHGLSRIDHESEADVAKKMVDTTYLDQIVGTYVRNNDHITEITIKRRAKTLFLLIPGRAEYELAPILSIFFGVKHNPGIKVLLFIDPNNVVQAIDIQSKNETIGAIRKRT